MKHPLTLTLLFAPLLLGYISQQTADAALITYSGRTEFLLDLPVSADKIKTQSFENFKSGQIFQWKNPMGGFSFGWPISNPPLMVANNFDTTDGNNYLGVDDPGNYNSMIAGTDIFSIYSHDEPGTPDYLWGIGMDFITSDPIRDGDIKLCAHDYPTPLSCGSISTVQETQLADGGYSYFLGIISTDGPFQAASIRFDPNATETFLYNVDRITAATSVPEPDELLLLVSALSLLVWKNRLIQSKGGNYDS